MLVVMDVDSTLIEDEVIELLAREAGSGAEVAEITRLAMSGELDFEASLARRVATLEGLDSACFDRLRDSITVTRGVPELIAAVHAAGGLVGVVSGGFHEIIDPICASLGLDLRLANRLEQNRDGRLTGRVIGDVVDARAKQDALLRWAAEAQVPMSRTVAIGDGANDLLMLEAAGLAVAFDAKPRVREAADVSLPGRDLTPVLHLLGLT